MALTKTLSRDSHNEQNPGRGDARSAPAQAELFDVGHNAVWHAQLIGGVVVARLRDYTKKK